MLNLQKDFTPLITVVILNLWNTASTIEKKIHHIFVSFFSSKKKFLFCIKTNVKETHKTESADKN